MTAMPPVSAPMRISQITVAQLRRELGLTLGEMGDRIGLSKSQMHDVERRNAGTLRVALALERLSGGRVDAAELCEEVRMARHAVTDNAKTVEVSTGNSNELSGGME